MYLHNRMLAFYLSDLGTTPGPAKACEKFQISGSISQALPFVSWYQDFIHLFS